MRMKAIAAFVSILKACGKGVKTGLILCTLAFKTEHTTLTKAKYKEKKCQSDLIRVSLQPAIN